jgi:bifunctional DNase/RNase
MKRIKLKVLSLAYTQTNDGYFILVLNEYKGIRKLPITINQNEAQSIAVKMESKAKVKTPQDLIKPILEALNAKLKCIEIHSILEGKFYTDLVILNSLDEEIRIPSSIGESVSLSIGNSCPIYTNEDVLGIAGIEMNDDGTINEEQMDTNKKAEFKKPVNTKENLQKMLNNALENEEYEIASQIRDRLKQLDNG